MFFFSSRRRHTRCYRDWSSDVCSSDLPGAARDEQPPAAQLVPQPGGVRQDVVEISGERMRHGISPAVPEDRELLSSPCLLVSLSPCLPNLPAKVVQGFPHEVEHLRRET